MSVWMHLVFVLGMWYLQSIGTSESPGFRCGIYKLSEYRSKRISRIRIYTKYWCKCTYVCPVFNRQQADDALARRFVFARRASIAERITRELGGVAKLRSRIMRRDWPRSSATRDRWEYLILYAAEPFGCLSCAAGPMRWPAVRFESRIFSAEIEYSRSRYFGDGSEYSRAEYARWRSSTLDPDISETVRNSQEPRTLVGYRVLSLPVSWQRWIRKSSTLDGDRILLVPRFSKRLY